MTILKEATDDVLLKRAAKGDEEAFTLVYRRHQAAIYRFALRMTGSPWAAEEIVQDVFTIYRFALRMTGSPWAAEEIVQDVFMTLVRDPKKYDSRLGTISAFLYGVARNRILKHRERLPREVALEEKEEDGSGPGVILKDTLTPAVWAEKRERTAQIRAAVLELPEEFREAVVLCELQELSYEEAAAAAGCPIGTIRSRLHRGRALLLAKLEMFREAPRRVSAAG